MGCDWVRIIDQSSSHLRTSQPMISRMAVLSTMPYDEQSVIEAKALHGRELECIETRLTPDTAVLPWPSLKS